MSLQLPWYVARASGIVAWGLLAGSVLWGLAMTTKTFKRVVRRPWLLDLHRFLGGLALIFTAVHVLAIMGDTYVHFGIAEVLVPLAAKWHPVAVAYGIVGLYLLAAVEFTSLARKSIPNSLWRRVHYLSFPLYLLTTVHLLTAGTDRHNPALRLAVLAVTSAVIGLLSVRINRDLMAVSAPAPAAARPRSTSPGRAPRPAGAGPRVMPLAGSAHADRASGAGGPSRPRPAPRPPVGPAPRGRG
jgi:DMSO/TMAO reductase YedYZ heme-binding membrane subunit